MQEREIQLFYGDTLFKRETNVESLIDGYLWERDVVMLLGSEKAGKSIIALQMACALSAGGMFLNKYKCKKVPVLYLQVEGKKDETPVRLEKMTKVIQYNKDYLFRMYKKFLPLDVDEYLISLRNKIKECPIKPEVIIVDCLYMAMLGDLNENAPVRKFIWKLSSILEEFTMTCILVHHAKREDYFEGKKVEKGDRCSYGSVFLRSNVDHILFFDMNYDKTRTLSCSTQRSGKVSDSETLVLVEPSPLYFQIKGAYTGAEETILVNVKERRITKSALVELTGYSESTVEKSLKTLVMASKINIVDKLNSTQGSPQNVYGVV